MTIYLECIASGLIRSSLSVGIGAAQPKLTIDELFTPRTVELQEGQTCHMYASAKKVDNLIATIDLNGKQIDAQLMKCWQWKYSCKVPLTGMLSTLLKKEILKR
jgi:transketolase N-terminal domain/subunit